VSRSRIAALALVVSLGAVVVLAWTYDRVRPGDAGRRQLWGLGQANYHEFREKLGARKLPGAAPILILGRGRPAPGAVTAAPAGGAFDGPVTVTLEGEGTIRYTLDGSIPTRRSPVYRGPLRLDSSAVVRARILRHGALPGPVATWHFIVGPRSGLPIVSLASDPVGLWGRYTGIYRHPLGRGRAWEREAHVGYIPAGTGSAVGFPAELRLHGSFTRNSRKKSFRIRYDGAALPDSLLPGAVFPRGEGDDERETIIRSGATDPINRIRDALATRLYAAIGGTVSGAEPVELFLNGAYWGIYDLRERIDEGFLYDRFGPGRHELLTHAHEGERRWLTPVVGTRDGWDASLRALESLDLTGDEGLAAAMRLIDVDGTIDYWIHNIYGAHADWPHNNVYVYRLDGPDRRWRWIAWDMDLAMDTVEHNTLAWALRDGPRNDLILGYEPGVMEDEPWRIESTLPIRALLRSPYLRDGFIARTQVLLDLHYTEERVLATLDSVLSATAPARRRDLDRWRWPDSTLDYRIDAIRRFARERPAILRTHLAERFGLGDAVPVRIIVRGPGQVRVERQPLPDSGATLSILRGTRLHIIARPAANAVLAGPVPPDTVIEIREPVEVEYRFVPRGALAGIRPGSVGAGRSRGADGS
jgi:hypothetical protein